MANMAGRKTNFGNFNLLTENVPTHQVLARAGHCVFLSGMVKVLNIFSHFAYAEHYCE